MELVKGSRISGCRFSVHSRQLVKEPVIVISCRDDGRTSDTQEEVQRVVVDISLDEGKRKVVQLVAVDLLIAVVVGEMMQLVAGHWN